MCWRFRTTRAAGAGGSQRLGASGDLYSASLARSPRALCARTAATALGRSARWRLVPWARPLCGRPPPPPHAPITGPIQPLAWGNAVAQPGGRGQAELLGLEEDGSCGAQPRVSPPGSQARAGGGGWADAGRGRGGGFPRVSPGARTARRVAPGQSDRLRLRPQSPWRARQRWPRARGEALRLAAVALFAGRGPDGVWVSETRALRDPSRAELTATACPGCRPRARGGGPAPAALPRTELTGRGLRSTGLGPAGCAALGS